MGFAERLYTSVVTDNMASNDLHMMPVDFVASLSAVSHLSSDMMRGCDYDKHALRRAWLILARDAIKKLHIGRTPAENLALVALKEVMHWQCRSCNGAGQVIAGDLKIVCPECEGVGTHRWSDSERAKAASIAEKDWPKWSKKYRAVLEIAVISHGSTIGLAKIKMGA